MENLRKMQIVNDNVFCSMAAKSHQDNDLICASLIAYNNIINNVVNNINKGTNVYLKGFGYSKAVAKQYNIVKEKQANSDFTHVILYKKDLIKDDFMKLYFYIQDAEHKVEHIYNKLYKNSSTPMLKEWSLYIIKELEQGYYLKQCQTFDIDNKMKVYTLSINQNGITNIITKGLRTSEISINSQNNNLSAMNKITGLDSYLNTFSEVLATKIQQSFIPKFIPDESEIDEEVKIYDDYCYDEDIVLYDAQISTIQSTVNNLKTNNVTFVVGEMGSGKTLIGAGIPYAHSKGRGSVSIVMCPSHLTNKWKREIIKLVPHSESYIVNNLPELIKLDDIIKNHGNKNIYLILSKERAKLQYDLRPIAIWSKSKEGFVCPECGQVLKKEISIKVGGKKQKIEVPLTKLDMLSPLVYNTTCNNTVKKWNNKLSLWEEKVCNNKLWAPLNNHDTNIKWTKLGSLGWVLTNHIPSLFSELMSKESKTKKESQMIFKLKEKQQELIKATKDSSYKYKNFNRAPRKYSLAKYIKENYTKHIDYLLADELAVAPYIVICK